MHMETEVTRFVGLPVYTSHGQFVGVVENVLLDLPNRRVGSLLLHRTSTKLVPTGDKVAVPYRWVAASGDIIILNFFPAQVEAQDETEFEEEEMDEEGDIEFLEASH